MATPRPWKSSGGKAVPRKPRRRKDCLKYNLQGKCEHGDKCKFAHDFKLEPHRFASLFLHAIGGKHFFMIDETGQRGQA